MPAQHNVSVGPGRCTFLWIITKADGKSLDSADRGCMIVTDCSGRRKNVEADGDTEAPVTRNIVMRLGETVSGGEIVSETEFRFAWTQRTGEWICRTEGFKPA